MSNIIPEGRYNAVIHDWRTGASAVKGTEFVNIGFKITGEGEFAGRVVEKNFWLSEKAITRSAKDFITLGYTGEDPLSDFGNAKKLDDVPGTFREVGIVVKHDEYNGNVRAEVAFINALSQPAPPVDAAKKNSFKSAFAAARADIGKPRAPAPTPMTEADDAPF